MRSTYRLQILQHAAEAFVVVDESGYNLDLTPRYGRAPVGVRVYEQTPRNTHIQRKSPWLGLSCRRSPENRCLPTQRTIYQVKRGLLDDYMRQQLRSAIIKMILA